MSFNIAGRFFWASASDRLGRKLTYGMFFVLGVMLYAALPLAAHHHSKALFIGFCCVILSMYGGGLATVPAYLADVFGAQFVGAIHGRLLTAWSTAGVLAAGCVANPLVRPLKPHWFITPSDVAAMPQVQHGRNKDASQRIGLEGLSAAAVPAVGFCRDSNCLRRVGHD